MSDRRAVVVPSTLLLLPEYAGQVDPVPQLRAACRAAVQWLVHGGGEVDVLAVDASLARRVAAVLLERQVTPAPRPGLRLLVVANGSATRTEKAPGHLDERAAGFDAHIEAALRAGDGAALCALDARLGADLWCRDVPALQDLGAAVARAPAAAVTATLDLADDPFGVQYWVARWSW